MNLLLDEHNNLVYTQTGLAYTDGDTQLLQDLTNRLRLLPQEYILSAEGVDYINNLHNLNGLLTTELKKDERIAFIDIQSTVDTTNYSHTKLDIHVKNKE